MCCKPEIDFKTGLQSGIIGDDAFIKTILEGEKEQDKSKCEDIEISTSNIISLVCSKYGVSEAEIASESRSRDLAHIRAVITLLARELKGVTIMEVAKKLSRSPGGLSRLANKLDRKGSSQK